MSEIKKILILSANPKDTVRLRLDEEVREIEEGLRRSKYRDYFIIRSKWAIRLRDLRRVMLDEEPQIVHFCGHGEMNGLMVEDENGNTVMVNSDALAGLFEHFTNTVECVLLNACYSRTQAEAIKQHIPYVIGMSKGIQDKTAIEFAVGFYDALGAGKSFEEAFEFGRNAIALHQLPEYLTPILKKKVNNSIQLVLEGDLKDFNDTTQKNLVNILSAILNVDKQSIKISRVIAGSIKVEVNLPGESAEELNTLIKEKDKKVESFIQEFHVKEVILQLKHIQEKFYQWEMLRLWLRNNKESLVFNAIKTVVQQIENTGNTNLTSNENKFIFKNNIDNHIQWILACFDQGTSTVPIEEFLSHKTDILIGCIPKVCH